MVSPSPIKPDLNHNFQEQGIMDIFLSSKKMELKNTFVSHTEFHMSQVCRTLIKADFPENLQLVQPSH